MTLALLGDQQGWVCEWCNEPVDRDAERVADRPSLDHIIPISRGGTNDLPNLHMLHFRCNAEKGAKIVL